MRILLPRRWLLFGLWLALVALLVVALGWWLEYCQVAAERRIRRAIEETAYQEAYRQFGKPGDSSMEARASKHGKEWWVHVAPGGRVPPDGGWTVVLSEDGKFIRTISDSYANYKDFTVRSGGRGELEAGLWGPIPSTICIQVADGSTFALKDLPESLAAKDWARSDASDTRPGDAVYRMGHAYLHFNRGKLTYANLDDSWDGLKLGSKLNGPFSKLPLTREQIIALFGEPLEWKRASEQAD